MHVRRGNLVVLCLVFAAMIAADIITQDSAWVISTWVIATAVGGIACRWWYGPECLCPACREIRAELAEKEQG
jgi:hypothetical protein